MSEGHNRVMSHTSHRADISLLEPSFERWAGNGSGREVAVLMSGGVDSSLSALLLKEAGGNVLGITMKIPVAEECDLTRCCCGAEAAFVCNEIGVPHYYLDVVGTFQELIIEPFRRSYSEGKTPNPCIDCNSLLKFGLVWDFIEETFGLRHLATGHYASVIHAEDGPCLMRARDHNKDQIYFIYGIRPERLALPWECMPPTKMPIRR